MSNGLTLPFANPLFSGNQTAFAIKASGSTAIEGIRREQGDMRNRWAVIPKTEPTSVGNSSEPQGGLL